MKVFVSFDGDHIGRMVGRASLADNPEEVSKIAQAIDRGNAVWRSWAESHGGKVINIGGDEGRLEVEADHLQELPKIRDQYAAAVGSTVSVGVGTKLSEADRSLMAAKLQGGDRIQLYTEEVNELLEELEDQGEGAKLYDEYLDPDSGLKKAQPGMNQGSNAGFSGASRSHPAAPQQPTEGSEHSEAEVLRQELANAPQTAPVVQPNGAVDYEQLFHQVAGQTPDDEAQKPSGLDDGVRAQVVKILQDVRAHAPEIAEMKSSNPDLYNSVKGLVDAMIALAQQQDQQPQQPIQKAEKECKHFFGRGTRCLKCKREKEELAKGWPRDEAENQTNASSAMVHQDLMAERGQLAARVERVGDTDELRPIVPDPGFKPMQPATNPKTGKVTVATVPGGIIGTKAAEQRVREARAANGPTLGNMGMESENARRGRQPEDVGRGDLPPHLGGLGDQMADVDAASRPLIPQWDGTQNVPGGLPDPIHFRWLHVPAGGQIVSTYGPQRDPGTYVTAHAGEDPGPADDGPLVGVYRYGPDGNVQEVPIADQRDPNSGLRVSGGKYVYQNMPPDLPPRLNREQWGPHGTTHGDPRVLAHIQQALANPNFEPPPLTPEQQWHADNAAATEAGRRGVPVRTPEQEKALANKDNTLAAMQARARALGIIKQDLDKAALEAGKTGRHQVVLPVGAQIDSGPSAAHEAGEIKVRDPESGKTKWRSVRSGLVMAPDGTPTSSRNPSGS